MFQLMASNKNLALNLVVDKSPRFTPLIMSDPGRVKQIIVNLISNAFKFTLRGAINLQIKQISEINIEISVIDTGVGIRDQDKTKLFKAFGKI
jgi:signal transduction histidine kinase